LILLAQAPDAMHDVDYVTQTAPALLCWLQSMKVRHQISLHH